MNSISIYQAVQVLKGLTKIRLPDKRNLIIIRLDEFEATLIANANRIHALCLTTPGSDIAVSKIGMRDAAQFVQYSSIYDYLPTLTLVSPLVNLSDGF